MLPSLHRLPFRTGEFYSLSQAEVNELNAAGEVDPITLEPFRVDVRRHGVFGWRKFVPGVRLNENTWRTFRVRSKDKDPNGDYTYRYYRSNALWKHYNRLVDGREPRDPVTRQRIWYEDWMDLHDAYDPGGDIPDWVLDLDARENGTVKHVPVTPDAPPNPLPLVTQRQNAPVDPEEEQREEEQREERVQRGTAVEYQYSLDALEFDRLLSLNDLSMRRELQRAQLKADRSMREVMLFKESQASRGPSYRDEWQRYVAHYNRMTEQRKQQVIQCNNDWLRHIGELVGLQLSGALEGQMRAWDVLAIGLDHEPTGRELEGQNQAFRAVEAEIIQRLRTLSLGGLGENLQFAQQLLASINNNQQARRRAIEARDAIDNAILRERIALSDSVTGFPHSRRLD